MSDFLRAAPERKILLTLLKATRWVIALWLLSSLTAQAQINWASRTPPIDSYRSVTYGTVNGNSLFVAVASSDGDGTQLTTSPDGITWTARTPAAFRGWNSVTYGTVNGNPLFVAVASTGAVMTSPNGITWASRTPASSNAWSSVTYGTVNGNPLFVAVASTGAVMTSPDGIAWTSQTSAVNNSWSSVTYGTINGNSLFVAVAKTGTGNRVMTSPDGIVWTSQTSASNDVWTSVTYGKVNGNPLFVAVSYSGPVMTSPDGIIWTSRTTPNNGWNSVTYGIGLFVAVGDIVLGKQVMTSPDGISWTSRTSASNDVWTSVTYGTVNGNPLFVAVAGLNVDRGTINLVMTSGNSALPVSLVAFSANATTQHTVALAWTTSMETNNKGFQLDRSKDLIHFETVGQIPSEAANSQALKQYQFTDLTPFTGTSYYRLTQTDLSGKVTVYPAVSVVIRDEAYGVYPNPVASEGGFVLRLDEPQTAILGFFNPRGRAIPLQKMGVQSGNLLLKTSGSLSAGVYVLTVEERGQTRQHRLVVQ